MKILFSVDKFYSSDGGPFSILKQTISALKKKKIKCRLIHNNKSLKLIYIYNLIKKIDILHFYGGWSLFQVKLVILSFLLKKKIIIQPLGFYEPWSLEQKKIKKKIAWFFYQKKILQISNLIHCASYQEKKNLLILDNNLKTKVLPYGIPNIFIKKKITKKIKINKKAIFFSRIHEKKGVENLVNCWNKINDKNWKLDIVGPCNDESYYLKIQSLAQNNLKIRFLKPIYTFKEKKKLFKNYDLLILPSFNENFGMVILEALSRGLPVLTTENTPWIDIKRNNSGWFISGGYNNLLLELKKIFKLNIFSFRKKSINALNLARKYDWSSLVRDYISVYKKVLND